MIDPYRELVDRIRGEIPDLEGVVQRALRAWPKAQNPSPEQEFYLDSVALNLQAFYAGAERLFELIARRMELGIETCSSKWPRTSPAFGQLR
jgi:hypothetical protein